MRDKRSGQRPERNGPSEVTRVARRQGGAISVGQANAAGLQAGQIKRQVAAGWLTQEHRGVLRLGTLTPDGHLWEALLMMGDDDAALSRLVAGYEHGLLRGRPPAIIDVTAPSQHRRRMPRKERERRLARFLADRAYPPHERNAEVRLDGEIYTVDVLFTGRKVVIEFDSREYHDNDPRLVSDRRRIRRFEANGWRLVPITSTDLTDRQDELDRDLKRILDIE